jgi:alpha-mannosidase
LSLNPPNVLIVSSKPARDGKGIILHLREMDGKKSDVKISCPILKHFEIQEVNVLEEILSENALKISLNPFEVKFFKLVF